MSPANPTPQELATLSQRELAVLRLTAYGYTATEIGEQLQISPKTVSIYRSRIRRKLKVHSRSEMVRQALLRGLLADQR